MVQDCVAIDTDCLLKLLWCVFHEVYNTIICVPGNEKRFSTNWRLLEEEEKTLGCDPRDHEESARSYSKPKL